MKEMADSGKITQVIGAVLDVKFAGNRLPERSLRLPMEQRPLHCPEAMPSPSDSTVTMYYIVLLPAWISHCCFPLP